MEEFRRKHPNCESSLAWAALGVHEGIIQPSHRLYAKIRDNALLQARILGRPWGASFFQRQRQRLISFGKAMRTGVSTIAFYSMESSIHRTGAMRTNFDTSGVEAVMAQSSQFAVRAKKLIPIGWYAQSQNHVGVSPDIAKVIRELSYATEW